MIRRTITIIATLILVLPAVAAAQVPDTDYCTAETAATEPVSVFCLPDGHGAYLREARTFGGEIMDATITVVIRDTHGDPIQFFPFQDISLQSDFRTLAVCTGGAGADASTDATGTTTFSERIRAGGASNHAGQEGVVVAIYNQYRFGDPMPIYFNSPDLNSDGRVNLTDIALFAQDFYGGYHYRSDFYWDGVLNLSDITLLSSGNGTYCM